MHCLRLWTLQTYMYVCMCFHRAMLKSSIPPLMTIPFLCCWHAFSEAPVLRSSVLWRSWSLTLCLLCESLSLTEVLEHCHQAGFNSEQHSHWGVSSTQSLPSHYYLFLFLSLSCLPLSYCCLPLSWHFLLVFVFFHCCLLLQGSGTYSVRCWRSCGF